MTEGMVMKSVFITAVFYIGASGANCYCCTEKNRDNCY